MPDDQKLSVLFDMLDKDRDGKLSAVELSDGLRKIRGDTDFEEGLALAIDRVTSYETVQNGMLDQKEFESLFNALLPLIGCTFQELSEILIMQVLFSDSSSTPVEETAAQVMSEVKEEVKVDEGLRHAMKDRRMKALFNVFDQDGRGSVDFKEVVVGMYKLMDDIDEASHAAVMALLLFDEKQTRQLSYRDFARLMLNVVASSHEHITFDEMADTLTRNAINVSSGITSDYVVAKYSMDTTSKLLLDISEEEEFTSLGVVELAKMERLFVMFDAGHDGKIDHTELALGLRYVIGRVYTLA